MNGIYERDILQLKDKLGSALWWTNYVMEMAITKDKKILTQGPPTSLFLL